MDFPFDLTSHKQTDSHRDEKETHENNEIRYNEIKQLNQRLMDFIHNQEQEHKQDLHELKTRLEANKTSIRKLEDENLTLKFQISSFKQKEAQYVKQINELKQLLGKYYHKVHSNETSQDQSTTPTRLPTHKLSKGLLISTNRTQKNDSNATDDTEPPSPQTAVLPKKPRDNLHERKISASHASHARLNKKIESDGSISQKATGKPPQSNKGKSIFCKKTDGTEPPGTGDSLDDELQLMSEPTHHQNPSVDLDLKQKENILLEETKSSLEDNARTLNHLPSKSHNSLYEPLEPKRPQSLILDSSGFARTLENFLEEGYRRKFNLLSQNIVALHVRPEISMAYLRELQGSRTITDLDEYNAAKRNFLKYVPKPLRRHKSPHSGTKIKSVKEVPLFEDFFVIGADREDLSSFMKQNPDQNRGSLKPKILYSYPTDMNSINEPPKSSIPEFAFPFGVDVYKLRSSPSFSSLNSIIYTSNDFELRSRCFIFPLLSTNPAEDRTNMGDIIEKSNPNHLLYIVCISFKDFINMTEKDTQPKSVKDIKYWQTQKIMCFVTYYPFFDLFFNVLMTFFRFLKVEREMVLSKTNDQDVFRHSNLDAHFTKNVIMYKYVKSEVEKNLQDLISRAPLEFSTKIYVNLMGASIRYDLEEAHRAPVLEASWACIPVFSYISLKDLLWFFSAYMLEKKLVFLSKNIHLLTGTLSVIRALIKPFKYPFPLIFNLPEVLMVLCDAPGAALIGINKGEDYLLSENLFEDYPSCIFVCLDEEKVYMDKENKPELAHFDNFEKNLLTHYAKLNSNLNYNIIEKKKSKQAKKSTMRLTGDEELQEKSKKVLELFHSTLEEKIIQHIPQNPIYKEEQNLDYDKIVDLMLEKIGKSDKKFLKQFLQTQIFTYYLEQHFQHHHTNDA